MDGTWVHTLEDGLEPISLSNRPPVPAPKPQRFQSVRVPGGRPKYQDRATPRRNSALYGAQDLRHFDSSRLQEGINGGFGDLSLVDPHNRLQKLGDILAAEQAREETEVIKEVIREPAQELETSEDPMLQTTPATRDCNWEQFKNRFPDERETFAIDVLLAQDDLVEQMEADQLRRLKPEERKGFESTRRRARQPRARKRTEKSTPIDRVRINSAIILGYLSKVTGEGPWVEKSHTFLAPFNLFLHFHEEMEEELRLLGNSFGEGVISSSGASTDEFDFLGNAELQRLMRSRRAYAEMKCYVNFVKTRLIPRRNIFSNADYTRLAKIRYRDLASLFRVGDLVVEPGVSQTESRIRDKRSSVVNGPAANVTEPKLWRVCYMSEDIPAWSVQNLDAPGGQLQGRIETGDEATHLRLYYIDFDGRRFSPVRGDVSVEFYEGEKEITKLPVYPLRFHKDHPCFLRELQERGQRFREIVSSGNPTFSYHGWTLTKDPSGRDVAARPGQETTWPEYIESDVIVDFNEAFQVHPWWKPAFQQFPEAESFYPTTTRDDFQIIEWSDRSRFREFASKEEMVVEYDGVRELEWAKFIETDAFVGQRETAEPLGHLTQTLSPDDLALLPSRLFVYALRSRSFINADIRYLKPVRDTLNPLESLQLPEKHKDMIQSAVFGHLEKKKVRRRATLMNSELMDQDIIHGKGRGLAVLLHGPPGVGKTATAEAIAHLYKKPLFPITSSDLGTDPWDVEAKLSEIFRLANLWDCILLLDEAETLLAQREKKDNNLQKSSLVSVFLRTLEYYSGILFLTTNRPDVMDDAVKSRVQVSLQYPRLGLIETLAIFQTNLDRLIDIEFERARITGEPALEVKSDGILAFAAAHYHRHEGNVISPPWNGRQIRNAFQIAPSIARYGRRQNNNNNNNNDIYNDNSTQSSTSSSSSSEQEPYVGPEHFEKVEESTTESETGGAGRQQQQQQTTTTAADDHLSPTLAPHASPNRQTAFPRRGIRANNRFSSEIQRNRFSGEFHLRQRSSSSVAPLYLPSTTQQLYGDDNNNKQQQQPTVPMPSRREPSPPWTPDLASVSDAASPRQGEFTK